jgi:DNA-binding GntR family transcriptional regulator
MGPDIRRLSKLEQALLKLVQSSEHPHSAKTAHRYLDYPAPVTVIAVRRALLSLAEKGYLARRQGYGRTVVYAAPLRNM